MTYVVQMVLVLWIVDMEQEAYDEIYMPVSKTMGCLFMTNFVIMGVVNAALFRQVRNHSRLSEADAAIFKNEQAVLITVFVLFELSYLSRFVFDIASNEAQE